MKNRTWSLLLCVAFLLCAVIAAALLHPRQEARTARIVSNGVCIMEVSLEEAQCFTVEASPGHYNVITVSDGAIAVTEATCPDHYCMHRGFCRNGSPIVCLPNKLVIEFAPQTEVDMVS